MDAFAISICKGLSINKMSFKKALTIAGYFGFFQSFMPICGYFLGTKFKTFVLGINYWIAFSLLLVIGVNMIKDSHEDNRNNYNEKTDFKTMLILSIATSIDALAVGITFALLKINIFFSSTIIGIITFLLSFLGVKIGNCFRYKT